ncbi:MAG: SRPBCC family protein [Verrucomicrobiota bacterium]
MKIIARKTIPLSIAEVWRVVSDPEQMPAWNPKCVLVAAASGAPETRSFEVLFQMNHKEKEASGKVVVWRVTEKVTYRYIYQDEFSGTVEESFLLQQLGPAVTRLVHEVDFSRSGLPWWVRILIGYIGRFGKLMGDDPLDGIERRIREA